MVEKYRYLLNFVYMEQTCLCGLFVLALWQALNLCFKKRLEINEEKYRYSLTTVAMGI